MHDGAGIERRAMTSKSRLALAIGAGDFTPPTTGEIAVWRPDVGYDVSVLPHDRVQIVQGFKPDFEIWSGRGYQTSPTLKKSVAASVICVPRAKSLAQEMIHLAAQNAGPILVDGQKTVGVDSLLRACRKRADVSTVISKAHGKLFIIRDHDGFLDWAGAQVAGPNGFTTAPGVFSADHIDAGSRLLVEALPETLGGRVADLGAGWGFLSSHILQRSDVSELHMVEAEYAAVECARQNISDCRAHFHWEDATMFNPGVQLDCVVMNPPFHTDRTADPNIGRAFITSAARLLGPSGTLWMVANRHLPYEAVLTERFSEVSEIGGNGGFKLLKACGPRRGARVRG